MADTRDARQQGRPPAEALRAKFAQAVALHEQERLAEAERLYREILQQQPQHFGALHRLGLIALQTRHSRQAAELIGQAIALNANMATAHINLGRALLDLKRPADALASFERAIALQPDLAEAHNERGIALDNLGRAGEALASYDRALQIAPGLAAAHCNRGNVLQALNRYEEAVASYDQALALRPDIAEAYSNRGNALLRLKRHAEALASYARALTLRPDYAEAHSNRGAVLQEMGRYQEALESYDRAIALLPDYSGAHANRGLALHQLMRFDEAIASFQRAYEILPDNAEAHFGEAQARLMLGDFARGWEEYEWRWRGQKLRHEARKFTQPLWRGEGDLAGKTILLHAEQGYGDTIEFCRYVPQVAARGARVVLEAQEPVRALMASLAGPAQVVATGSPLPEFDLHCPLLSLPLVFETRLETIPAAVPYLDAAPQAAAAWGERLGEKRRPRIGLAWSGRIDTLERAQRSIALAGLLPLLEFDASFVSLQKDVRPADASLLQERNNLLHFGDALKDFSDTAAIICHLDLVISIDSAVAHLAGAMAKPLWLLLPYVADWRWLLERSDSPWYPTARLFRQDETRTWDSVVARVHDALGEFMQSR
jgi:tetratricopeptide (TPR) repeat protein